MAKTLQLHFTTSVGKNVMLTVDEPRENVTTQEVEAAMQQVIESGVFIIEGAALAAAKSARIVERHETDLAIG